MTTPKDRQRVAAFREWYGGRANPLAACSALDLNPRTVERFLRGQKPPPPRLLEQIADSGTLPRGVADRLRAAAQPAEATDA